MKHGKLIGLQTSAERLARVAVAAYDAATAPQTAPSGSISLDNADGTRTIIGPQAGSGEGAPSGQAIATHVGDTTPPPVPTGITAWSGDGSLHVAWDGTLSGDIPADFGHISILVDGREVAQLSSAGSVTVGGVEAGATVSVTATAEDDACLADGTPAHNVSAPCVAVSVTIRDAVAEVRADADAHGEQIDAVKQDIAAYKASAEATYATKTEVDERTGAITRTLAADYTKTVDLASTDAVKDAKGAGTAAQTQLAGYKATNDKAVAAAKKAGTDAQSQLAGYKSSVEETYAEKTELTEAVNQLSSTMTSNYSAFTDYRQSNDAALSKAQSDATDAQSAIDSYKASNDRAVADAKAAGTTAQDQLGAYKSSNDAAVKDAKKAGTDAQSQLGAYKTATDQRLTELKNIADNAIESFYLEGAPTASNPPASSWTTDALKRQHAGDLYMDTDTGYSYRWSGTEWVQVKDSDVTKALKEIESVKTDYATKSELSATDTELSGKVSDALTTAKSYTDGSVAKEVTARNAAIKAQADSISLDVSRTYTRSDTFSAYQTDADGRIATANSNASTAVSTAQTAASDAATAKTDASSAVSTANSANTKSESAVSTANSAVSTANAAQSTADGAAKQANLYTIGLGDAGAVAKWIHLGTLTSAGDSSSATISIVFGNGHNGRAGQNSALTITIKDGYQNPRSATGACGVTAMRENCDNALVDVLAQSATVYDVWVYAPWPYSNGRYSVSGQYATWQHSGATQKDEPATSATQVKQDVAYRLADATKAQTMATENKSSIRQLSDSITSEVTERSKLAGRVGTLESTSGTHTSKLEQLATSIKSLVKGESTYTDPDGASATSGIYSLVTQTRDSVTALFGQYTKTEDLAATDAVKDAKKAGTDAQAAASAAQTTADSAKSTAQAAASDAATAKTNAASAVSTANSASTSAANAVETANAASSTASSASSTANSAASTANSAMSTADAAKTSAASAVSTANSASSTAGAAKSTADSLATMVRQYSGGVLVGKVGAGVCALVNADGSFDVADVTWDGETPTVGDAITTFESNAARFFGGLAAISSEHFSAGRNLVLSHVGDESQDMPALSLSAMLVADISEKYHHEIKLHPGGNGAGIVHADGPVYAQFGVYAPYGNDFMYSNPTVLFTGSYDYTKGHPVTLSEPASNFCLMTIIARGAYGVYGSQTVFDPDGKQVAFDIANVRGTYREHHSKVYQIQGQYIDTFHDDNGYWEGKMVVNGGAVSQVRESCVGIECVIGWRKGGQL